MRTCLRPTNRPAAPRAKSRRGLTLVELLVATAVLALIAAAMGTISLAVHTSSEYVAGQTGSLQHARVTIDRIEQHLRACHFTEEFPGCTVIAQSISGYSFPDAIAIWKPTGTPASPTGRPRVSELLFIAPDPADPSKLYEWRLTSNGAQAPTYGSTSSWRTLLSQVRGNSGVERVLLTDRLHTAAATSSTEMAGLRFFVEQTPSRSQVTEYRNGSRDWDELTWPLDVYGLEMGLQLSRVTIELQLDPGDESGVIPFFGSASRRGAIYP